MLKRLLALTVLLLARPAVAEPFLKLEAKIPLGPVPGRIDQDGKRLATVAICGDADDAFVDDREQRVYVTCGDGRVEGLANRRRSGSFARRRERQ